MAIIEGEDREPIFIGGIVLNGGWAEMAFPHAMVNGDIAFGGDIFQRQHWGIAELTSFHESRMSNLILSLSLSSSSG
jgi:hypothetical protein